MLDVWQKFCDFQKDFTAASEIIMRLSTVMWGRVYQQHGRTKDASKADAASTDGAERQDRQSPAAEGAGSQQWSAPLVAKCNTLVLIVTLIMCLITI